MQPAGSNGCRFLKREYGIKHTHCTLPCTLSTNPLVCCSTHHVWSVVAAGLAIPDTWPPPEAYRCSLRVKPHGRRPGSPGRKEEKDRGRGEVSSVPVVSVVCTVHTSPPKPFVPWVSPESTQAIFNPAERKVDPRIRKK